MSGPLPHAPWGAPVGTYFALAGMASGLTLVSSFVPEDVQGAQSLRWRTAWASTGTIFLCVLILLVDLGRPERFFLMLTEFSNLGSAMSLGAKLLAVKGILLGLYLYFLHRLRRARAAGDVSPLEGATKVFQAFLSAALALTALAVAVYPAFVLSRTWLAPLARSPITSFLFVSTAMLMGWACAVLLSLPSTAGGLAMQLGRLSLPLVVIQGVLLLVHAHMLRDGGRHQERALEALLSGHAAPAFWALVVVAGLAVPLLALSLLPPRRATLAVSAAAVLLGAGATRYLIFSVR